MSRLLILTFDLNKANAGTYDKITRRLRKVDFKKKYRRRKLPDNTYVLKIDDEDNDANNKKLRRKYYTVVKKIIQQVHSGKATIFLVIAGKYWSFRIGEK